MKRIINNILEWIGYHFIGYKVDIKHLEKTINKLKDKNLNDLSELLAFDNKLEKRLNEEINATNNAFEDVASDIIEVEKKVDKSIKYIKSSIDNINLDNDCGVCDKFVKSNAEQQTEIDQLKDENKEQKEIINHYTNNDTIALIEYKNEEIKELKKHNNYYMSQIKAIKRIAEKPLDLCGNLNDIISICNDMGIDYNNINLTNEKE